MVLAQRQPIDMRVQEMIIGARGDVVEISDGDVGAALNCGFAGTGIHALIGIGAAPEGVITAAAMKCLGGHFQGQLIYDPAIVKTGLIGESKEANIARLKEMGINDPDKVYTAEELACGQNVLFAGTGITSGNIMDGVRFFKGGARTGAGLEFVELAGQGREQILFGRKHAAILRGGRAQPCLKLRGHGCGYACCLKSRPIPAGA